jgi:effector-binding domain-containing protein
MKVMPYDVQVKQVRPRPIAAARRRATARDLGRCIGECFDAVYDFLTHAPVRQAGHNIVLYWNAPDGNLLATEEGVPIEAGVQVAAAFEDTGNVVCSATPGGTVATVVHRGPYEQLPQAHAALLRWCREHNRAVAGPNWEVYGDWNDQPDQLRTDVFYLLK